MGHETLAVAHGKHGMRPRVLPSALAHRHIGTAHRHIGTARRRIASVHRTADSAQEADRPPAYAVAGTKTIVMGVQGVRRRLPMMCPRLEMCADRGHFPMTCLSTMTATGGSDVARGISVMHAVTSATAEMCETSATVETTVAAETSGRAGRAGMCRGKWCGAQLGCHQRLPVPNGAHLCVCGLVRAPAHSPVSAARVLRHSQSACLLAAAPWKTMTCP